MSLVAEKTKLLKRDAEWSALASEGRDVDAILSYWTDDATVIPPNLPTVEGKQALRGYVEQSLHIPGFRITWESTDATFSPDGKLAYLTGTNVVTMDGPDGATIRNVGRVLTIWRKETDGEWRCAIDIWNSGPAA
jgi:ketosteroid isomerase-like protein